MSGEGGGGGGGGGKNKRRHHLHKKDKNSPRRKKWKNNGNGDNNHSNSNSSGGHPSLASSASAVPGNKTTLGDANGLFIESLRLTLTMLVNLVWKTLYSFETRCLSIVEIVLDI